MTRRPENRYGAYHAHVYFDADTVEHARTLRERAGPALPMASIGRFHEKPVGPHPKWSFQVAFAAAAFDTVIGWLEAERDGLDVLVHGLTGSDYADHTDHAMWLGNGHTLDLRMFSPGDGRA